MHQTICAQHNYILTNYFTKSIELLFPSMLLIMLNFLIYLEVTESLINTDSTIHIYKYKIGQLVMLEIRDVTISGLQVTA